MSGTQLASFYGIPTSRTSKIRIWPSSLLVPKDSPVRFQSLISPKICHSTPVATQKTPRTKVETRQAHLH